MSFVNGKRLGAGVIAVFLALATAAPASAQMGPHETQGTMGGAMLGGVIGSLFGGGAAGHLAGGLIGAAVGGFVGNRIGAELDKQDRLALNRATHRAFVTGRSQRFARRHGARGRVVVVRTHVVDGRPCRKVKQVVVFHGRTLRDTVTACRGPHGGWQV